MSDDENVNVKFGADTTSLVGGTKEATEEVKTFSSEVGKSAAAATASSTQLAGSLSSVSAAAVSTASGMRQASTEIETASHGTAGFYREIVVLGHEIVSGNFSRIPGSMMVLAERSGSLVSIFEGIKAVATPMNLAIAAVGVTLGILADQAITSAEALNKVDIAMQAVGNERTFDPSQIQAYITQLNRMAGISRKEAREAMAELGISTHMTQDQMRELVGLLPNLSAALGTDLAGAAKFAATMMDNPAKAADELKNKFNLLTPAQREVFQNFENLGNVEGQQNVLIDAMTVRFQGLYEKGLNPIIKALDAISARMRALGKDSGLANLGIDVTHIEPPAPKETAMNDAVDKYRQLNQQINTGIELEKRAGLETEKRAQLEGQIVQLKKAQAAASAVGDTGKASSFGLDIKEVENELAGLQGKGKKYLAEMARDQKAAMADKRSGLIEDLNEQKTFAQEEFAIEEEKIKQKRDAGTISAQQELQALVELKQREFQTELQALNDEAALWKEGSKQYKKVQDEIVLLKQKTELDIQRLNTQSIKQQEQAWNGFFSSIKSSFNSSISGLLQGTETFGGAIRNVFLGVGQAVAGVFEGMAAKWVINEIIGETASKAQAVTAISASAGQAGAAAYASTAAIPIVGPELAPAAAASAYSGAMAYVGLASYDVGSWSVPSDQVANIHQGEMILPKPFAESVRENGGMGGGGDTHFHVSAIDGQSVARFFKENASTIARTVAGQHRNFNPALSGMKV